MSPRTGRPHKEKTKEITVSLRMSDETAEKLNECTEKLSVPKTEVIEKGIDLVHAAITKK